jgi:hypothetical protein
MGTKPFPPTSENDLTPVGAASFALRSLSCTRATANDKFATCESYVNGAKGNKVCDIENSTTTKVRLIALNAGWNGASGAFDFAQTNRVVFGCLDTGVEDKDDRFGALGKCIRFEFFPRVDGDSQLKFLACIRATRSDICANGLAMTEPGTPYAIYDLPATAPGICQKGQCWEASWNEGGATCMNHRRYFQLLFLASLNVDGAWSNVKATRSQPMNSKVKYKAMTEPAAGPKTPVKPSPKEWSRAAPGLAERIATKKNPLAACSSPSPVQACLDQFTRYFYDDGHEMDMIANPNPIDPVTAQIVCRPGFYRLDPTTIQTRTAVRVPGTAGGYDILDCCDTFPDCPHP